MSDTTLFFAPNTCARVPLIALEEAGLDYSLETIAFMAGDHKKPEFLARNPKGKVPALHINGLDLTENVAILDYLTETFPEANLLPKITGPLDRANRLADLAFCSATLHPIVTRIRMAPFIAGPPHARAVWQNACAAMDGFFELIEARLAEGPWWYGEQWSVMDAYLNWVFFRVEGARYDTSRFPKFAAHNAALQERPSVQRALAAEQMSDAELAERGFVFTPPDPATFA